MKRLSDLYMSVFGHAPDSCMPLAGSASNRKYYRLAAGQHSCIGVIGTDADENKAFLTISRHFLSKGISVPEVYAAGADGMSYLQEDLGQDVLYDMYSMALRTGKGQQEVEELLCRTVAMLPRIQFEGAAGLDFSICYPQPAFDRRMVMFDLNYFKYCFLKPSGLEFNEVRLQDDFDRFADDLLAENADTFLYRDFNARNVMIRDGQPYFIDFQGGRRGPIYYDVASFVYHSRSAFPQELKDRMLDAYLTALGTYTDVDRCRFMERLSLFVLFRQLQVLGAYGFRGLVEQKADFVVSIPAAISDLKACHQIGRYPYLEEVLGRLTALPAFRLPSVPDGTLEVKVYSFSFKKGVPYDSSGNGGGYVFDCRSIHNPGRYQPYRNLTGRDEPVIRFLEEDGEVFGFLEHVYGIVDPHVETYRSRGFTSLMVSFGCTGGQHRSVYCAESMARHLAEKYPDIRVRLVHREQGTEVIGRAMIFAAGMGTRLRPLTDTLPKALVPVCGKPLIEHVTSKLKAAGVDEFVVNVHHLADKVEQWIESQEDLRIQVSDERKMLLETGGAVLYARPYLEGRGRFLIYNVDILSDIDISWFAARVRPDALATLLVSDRPSTRCLLFESDTMRLVGWMNNVTGEVRSPYGANPEKCLKLAFSGIHVMSDAVFEAMESYVKAHGLNVSGGAPRFPVMDFYIWACGRYCIYGVRADGMNLIDVGKPGAIEAAGKMFSPSSC